MFLEHLSVRFSNIYMARDSVIQHVVYCTEVHHPCTGDFDTCVEQDIRDKTLVTTTISGAGGSLFGWKEMLDRGMSLLQDPQQVWFRCLVAAER